MTSNERMEEMERILLALRLAWEENPEQRLGQLVVNALGRDPFHTGDEIAELRLGLMWRRGRDR